MNFIIEYNNIIVYKGEVELNDNSILNTMMIKSEELGFSISRYSFNEILIDSDLKVKIRSEDYDKFIINMRDIKIDIVLK